MKKILLIPTAFLLSFCCTKKDTSITEVASAKFLKIESPCPTDGTCTTEVLKNKSLVVKTDEFGSMYTQTIDSKNTSVIVYQYNRTVKGDIQDANYREEVVFEIKNTDTNLDLENGNLQQTKMLFGRFCFCRGQTGYYNIENGNLKLNKSGDEISFNLDFTITKVPQIIKSIKTVTK